MYQIPLMCLLLKEIEFRRLVKNLIRKISTKIFWSLIKSKNLEIIMKNFSWVFLDEYRLIVNYKKPIDYKKLFLSHKLYPLEEEEITSMGGFINKLTKRQNRKIRKRFERVFSHRSKLFNT